MQKKKKEKKKKKIGTNMNKNMKSVILHYEYPLQEPVQTLLYKPIHETK